MMGVSTSYEQTGRSQQKRRTRDQLIDATRTLIAENGAAPTVAEAAEAALISRTTAYRYFPNQTALLVAAHPETAATSLLPPGIGDGAEDRLAAVVKAFHDLIIDTETQQRTMLMLSLQSGDAHDLPLRKGRAIAWFEDALAPLRERFSEAELHRLAVAVRSAVGIESMIWLTDVAGLSPAQAARLMQWSAQALLREAVTHGVPPDPRIRSSA
jgi:AcrR family transcriptional regulator